VFNVPRLIHALHVHIFPLVGMALGVLIR